MYGVTRSNNSDFKIALDITNKESRERIEKLILSEIKIKNIVDYYNVFEMELLNRDLGKNLLKFDL